MINKTPTSKIHQTKGLRYEIVHKIYGEFTV